MKASTIIACFVAILSLQSCKGVAYVKWSPGWNAQNRHFVGYQYKHPKRTLYKLPKPYRWKH